MSPFEYVIVLISIILGLGITVVLTGVAGLIRYWKSVSVYYPYLIWVALVFTMHIHEWWIMYEWRTMESWNILTFLFIILYPILLFILANLLFPKRWRKKGVNLRNFYFRMYPKFFVSALVLIATAIASDVVISGRPFNEQSVKLVLFGIILTLYLIKPKHTWVHAALAIFLLLLMIGSLAVLSDELVIR
jgi:hypothetical protein